MEAKHDSPIGPNSDRPKALAITFEWMKMKGRNIKVLDSSGHIESRQNLPDAL